MVDISVKQTPSQDIDDPRSFEDNFIFDLINKSIPFDLLLIFFAVFYLIDIPAPNKIIKETYNLEIK